MKSRAVDRVAHPPWRRTRRRFYREYVTRLPRVVTYCFVRIVQETMHRFAIALLVGATVAWSAPYTPPDDSAVLERLPTRRDDPVMAELRQLRAALAASPSD